MGLFEKKEIKLLQARFNNKPISEYPDSYFHTDEYIQKIVGWGSLSGVRDVPDQQVFLLLKKYLTERVNALTFEEIEEALWMNVDGKYKEVLNPYNVFDVKFLSSVIREFNRYRKLLDDRYQASLKAIPEPKLELSPAQRDFMYVEKAVIDYDLWLAGEPLHGAATLYDNLVRMELIPADELLVQALRDQIKERYGVGTYNNRTSAFEASWISNILKDEVKLESTAEIEAKTELLANWFQQLWNANTSLPELLVDNFNRRHAPLYISPIPTPIPNSPKPQDSTPNTRGGETTAQGPAGGHG